MSIVDFNNAIRFNKQGAKCWNWPIIHRQTAFMAYIYNFFVVVVFFALFLKASANTGIMERRAGGKKWSEYMEGGGLV